MVKKAELPEAQPKAMRLLRTKGKYILWTVLLVLLYLYRLTDDAMVLAIQAEADHTLTQQEIDDLAVGDYGVSIIQRGIVAWIQVIMGLLLAWHCADFLENRIRIDEVLHKKISRWTYVFSLVLLCYSLVVT